MQQLHSLLRDNCSWNRSTANRNAHISLPPLARQMLSILCTRAAVAVRVTWYTKTKLNYQTFARYKSLFLCSECWHTHETPDMCAFKIKCAVNRSLLLHPRSPRPLHRGLKAKILLCRCWLHTVERRDANQCWLLALGRHIEHPTTNQTFMWSALY